MGLDMYLTKKTYVKNWDYMKQNEKHEITIKKGGKERTDIKSERICYVEEEVAYWRKANAIHRWFVENVQGGKDDCREYYVEKEKLGELLAAVTNVLSKSKLKKGKIKNGYQFVGSKMEPIIEDGKVIVNPEIAAEILPTTSGFFFGGTDYDEGYVDDLIYTKKILASVLGEGNEGEFYYHSSW